MKDKMLQVTCRKFAEDNLRLLALSSREDFPMTQKQDVKINKDRKGFAIRDKQVPDLYDFLFLNREKISETDSFKAFIECMQKNSNIKKFHTDSEINKVLPRRFLGNLITDEEKFSWDFKEEKFNEVYESFEAYLFSGTIPFKAFVILPQLTIETEGFSLDDNLKIRKLSDKEFEKLVTSFSMGMTYGHFLYPDNLILERVFDVQKKNTVVVNSSTGEQNEENRKLFINVITALRIFKKGKVGFDAIYEENISEWEGGSSRLGSPLTFPETLGGRLNLMKTEEIEFKKFWNFFTDIKLEKLDKNMRIAVNRFNAAFGRRDAEDRLIDYVIALTSLFSKKDESGLGRYRLSMRVALFLAKTPEERMTTRKEILEIYDVRSKIVHGNDVKKFRNFKDLKTLVDKTEDYLRRSIKELIQLNLKIGGRSKIINNIENSLFSAPIDFNTTDAKDDKQ